MSSRRVKGIQEPWRSNPGELFRDLWQRPECWRSAFRSGCVPAWYLRRLSWSVGSTGDCPVLSEWRGTFSLANPICSLRSRSMSGNQDCSGPPGSRSQSRSHIPSFPLYPLRPSLRSPQGRHRLSCCLWQTGSRSLWNPIWACCSPVCRSSSSDVCCHPG